MRRVVVPAAVLLLLSTLGFFAFRGGLGNLGTPTGNVVVEEVNFLTYFDIENLELEVNAKNVSIINSMVKGKISSAEITGEAPIWITEFSGTISVENHTATLKGRAKQFSAIKMSFSDSNGIPVEISFTKGTFEITDLEFSKFSTKATGELTLEDKIKLNLDSTPVMISDFKGFIRNDLVDRNMVTFQGKAGNLEIEEGNFLQKILD